MSLSKDKVVCRDVNHKSYDADILKVMEPFATFASLTTSIKQFECDAAGLHHCAENTGTPDASPADVLVGWNVIMFADTSN